VRNISSLIREELVSKNSSNLNISTDAGCVRTDSLVSDIMSSIQNIFWGGSWDWDRNEALSSSTSILHVNTYYPIYPKAIHGILNISKKGIAACMIESEKTTSTRRNRIDSPNSSLSHLNVLVTKRQWANMGIATRILQILLFLSSTS
jgi:hypothetical protein